MSSTASPTRPPAQKRPWVLPVVGFVVIVTFVGGLAVRSIYRQPDTGASMLTAPPATSVPPAGGGGHGSETVQLTDDASNSRLGSSVQLSRLLQAYFDSINNGDYAKWTSVVTTNLREENPARKWDKSYQTTEDHDIVVHRVDVAPQDGLRVMLTFTSNQNPADAPKALQVECIHWRVVWSLTQENRQWKIDTSTANRTPQMEKC